MDKPDTPLDIRVAPPSKGSWARDSQLSNFRSNSKFHFMIAQFSGYLLDVPVTWVQQPISILFCSIDYIRCWKTTLICKFDLCNFTQALLIICLSVDEWLAKILLRACQISLFLNKCWILHTRDLGTQNRWKVVSLSQNTCYKTYFFLTSCNHAMFGMITTWLERNKFLSVKIFLFYLLLAVH